MQIFLRPEFYRWRIRRLLNFLYPIISAWKLKSISDVGAIDKRIPTIGFLFSGTYGDFVQALPSLNFLSHHFSNSTVLLYHHSANSLTYVKEFNEFLPANIRQVSFWRALSWIFFPQDFLMTNSVGVYRISFDLLACFGAQRAIGFRHHLEPERKWFSVAICLDLKVKNFGEENFRLMEKMGIDLGLMTEGGGKIFIAEKAKGEAKKVAKDDLATNAVGHSINSISENDSSSKILFHIGAAGLKRDFGNAIYSKLVLSILKKMETLWVMDAVKIVMGPGDEDIAQMVMSQSQWTPELFSISELSKQVSEFTGTVICFNSFFAHLCFYLNRPAIVIHRETVPYGYDCTPLHSELILKSSQDWNLSEVFDALKSAKNSGTQFLKN